MYVRGLVNITSRQIGVCVYVGIIEPEAMNVLISKGKWSDYVLNRVLVCPSFIKVFGWSGKMFGLRHGIVSLKGNDNPFRIRKCGR